MKLIGCDISEFMQRIKDKEVVCWGAGTWLRQLSDEFNSGIENCFSYVVDSNEKLWGTKVVVGEKELEIHPPQRLYDTVSDRTALLITFASCLSLLEELNLSPKFDCVECYSSLALWCYENNKILYSVPPIPDGYRMNETPQIPKQLHYTWFSGEPLPDNFKKCLESWYKHCPEYEITEWNQKNYDLTSHPYMRDALKVGRYGFAADYARLDIIYNHGGIYLDLDVEVVRNLDELLYYSAYCGFHTIKAINLGQGFGARARHPMIKSFRDAYDTLDFYSTEKPGATNIYETSPQIQTPVMRKHGLKLNGEFQIVCDMAVLPVVYFNPYDPSTDQYFGTEQTFSVHKHACSWLTENERLLRLTATKYVVQSFSQ